MAFRRMINIEFTDNDPFNSMPAEVQLTYMKLITHADDDGFVSKPLSIARDCHANAAALDMLIDKDYLIRFDSGIILIRHWRIHNYLRKDRYHKTIHTKERKQVVLGEDKIYRRLEEAQAAGLPLLEGPIVEAEIDDEDSGNKASAKEHVAEVVHINFQAPVAQPAANPVKNSSEQDHAKEQESAACPSVPTVAEPDDRKTPLDAMLRLGPGENIWLSKNRARLLEQLYPDTWQQKLEEVMQHRLEARKDFGYALRGPLNTEEEKLLFGSVI